MRVIHRKRTVVSSPSKIVSLDKTRSSKSGAAAIRGSLPPVLHTIRGRARKLLNQRLQGLFNGADDALFEMADRSRSDADQNMYFDAMRELRLQRRHIAEDYSRRFYKGFDDLFDGILASESDDDLEADDMALLRNDELEVSVAVNGIVSKVLENQSNAVLCLTRRIDSLCKVAAVTDDLNPMGPAALGRAFAEVTGTLEAPIKVRLILLKLFERYVMEQLEPIYAESNRLLAEAGVLPDLKRALKDERASRPSPSSSETTDVHRTLESSSGANSPTGAEQGFDLLQGLLAQARGPGKSGVGGSGGGSGMFAGGSGFAGGGGSGFAGGGGSASGGLSTGEGGYSGGAGMGPATLISTDQLMGMLNTAQYDAGSAPIDLDTPPALLDLREFVLTRAPSITGEDHNKIEDTEDDVVNLVGMLFDYILNDRNLAIPMKALIGRLQIPVLKIAIIDKTFFDKTSHPARLLLNELSSAGIGWSNSAELKRDALYDKIESIILRVLNGFGDDMALISELVSELREFVQTDRQRNSKVEARVKETETGRAKTKQAKITVQRLINQKACGLRLPSNIGQFLSDSFSRVMVLLCVRNGQDSSEWREALNVMDDLLWSAQALETSEDMENRDALIDTLVPSLGTHLELINLGEEERQALLDDIRQTLVEIAEHDRAFLADEIEEPVDADFAEIDEIVLTSIDDIEEALPEVEPEPKYLEQIQQLTEGTWIELSGEDGKPLRCKLATIVLPNHRYVFVNRRGMKVAERTRMGLACDLKAGRLSVLDESEVFDRALQAVIGSLRQMHERPQPAA